MCLRGGRRIPPGRHTCRKTKTDYASLEAETLGHNHFASYADHLCLLLVQAS